MKKILPILFVFALPAHANNEFTSNPFIGLKTDAYQVGPNADMDGDGISDWLDDDIDGDGISNDYEVRLGFDPRDPNSTPPDLDGDGIPDAFDNDIDGDGIFNNDDAFPYNPKEWADLDGDGVGDNSDPDIDSDGISNEYEIKLGFDPRNPNSTPPDMDGDGIPDALDDDIDGDGVSNKQDAFPYDPNEWADTDADGIGDNSDPDVDGDGFTNEEEIRAGSDPYDKNSFPDVEPPVVGTLEWKTDAENTVQGMAFDDGVGISAIWLESSSGQRCNGAFEYGNRFVVSCPELANGYWQLFAEDKVGNKTQQPLPAK